MSRFSRAWATGLRTLPDATQTSELLDYLVAVRAGGPADLFDDALSGANELIGRSSAIQGGLEAVFLGPAAENTIRTKAGARLAMAKPFALETHIRSPDPFVARSALEQSAISIAEGGPPGLPAAAYLDLLAHPNVGVSALAADCVSFLYPPGRLLEMARSRGNRYDRVALADAVLKTAPWHSRRSDLTGEPGPPPPALSRLTQDARDALRILKADFDGSDPAVLARFLETMRHYWPASPLFQEEVCEALEAVDDPDLVDGLASVLNNCDATNPRVRAATLRLASHPAAGVRANILYAMTLQPGPFLPELGPILVATLLDKDGCNALHALRCFQQNTWLVRENREALRAIKRGPDRERMDPNLIEEFDRLVR